MNYIKQDLAQLKKALGIEKLSQGEQEEILKRVDSRLKSVVIDTVLKNISDEEAREFKDIIMKGENVEDNVARIGARIPELAEKLESAVSLEIDRLGRVLAA